MSYVTRKLLKQDADFARHNKQNHQKNARYIILVFLLLTLNKLGTLIWYFNVIIRNGLVMDKSFCIYPPSF